MAHSPLDQFSSILEIKCNIQLNRLERRQQHVVPPRWISSFTCIDKCREAAVKQHDSTDIRAICIYTDGSGINGHIGAAAIASTLQLRDICTKQTEYMGKPTTSTVYAAELRGI